MDVGISGRYVYVGHPLTPPPLGPYDEKRRSQMTRDTVPSASKTSDVEMELAQRELV